MKKHLYWKALFSQSGSEILEISTRVGRFPDTIITNKSPEDMDKINPVLLEKAFDRFIFIPKKPAVEEYKEAIKSADIVTLHGFLRVLPPDICGRYRIFNGHPGLITKFPELKGKDPQAKVWWRHADTPYRLHGHVIHKVVPEVDAGEVVSVKEFYSQNIYSEHNSLNEYIARLHKLAIENWVEFVKKQVILNTTHYAN
jgi:folate-dependent phosphoribosylglycinamide formyltransferase PurN